jgi:hypothetical protein
VLGGYFTPVEEGRRLRITDDPDGRHPWPTAEEAERAEKERALARIAELEQALRARGSE